MKQDSKTIRMVDSLYVLRIKPFQVRINTQDQLSNLGFPLISEAGLSVAFPSTRSERGEEFCETCLSWHGLALIESSSDFILLTLKTNHKILTRVQSMYS